MFKNYYLLMNLTPKECMWGRGGAIRLKKGDIENKYFAQLKDFRYTINIRIFSLKNQFPKWHGGGRIMLYRERKCCLVEKLYFLQFLAWTQENSPFTYCR